MKLYNGKRSSILRIQKVKVYLYLHYLGTRIIYIKEYEREQYVSCGC